VGGAAWTFNVIPDRNAGTARWARRCIQVDATAVAVRVSSNTATVRTRTAFLDDNQCTPVTPGGRMPHSSASRTRRVLATTAAILAATAAVASQSAPPRPPPPTLPENVAIRFVRNPRPPRPLSAMVMTVPAENPITDAKAALGRRLFFDPLLSNDRSVSCATCHDPERAFADARPLAIGVFGRTGKRHSPSLVNRGFGKRHFWDGRSTTLEEQVLQPIVDPNEMDLALDDAVGRLRADEVYRADFNQVFARAPSSDDLAYALATYLRTLRSSDSPYDRFVAGDPAALTEEQKAGLQIFRTKGFCTVCHVEPLFTDEEFHNTGVAWQPGDSGAGGRYLDDGRFAVSRAERDRGRFKTPTLRDVARTAPYMHDGSFATLDDVVEFYNRGGRPNPNLFPIIRPLRLTAEEKQALVEFLESLNGTISK
jgi:cytochrome c peroxidase